MNATRVEGWELRLVAEIEAAETRTFEYGVHDCAAFAARCMLAITGTDFFRKYRGRYMTKEGAARLMKRAGGLAGIMQDAVGPPLATPFLAQRGDVVLVENDGSELLAVVMGEYAFAPAAGANLVALPMQDWRTGWRVG